MNYSVRWPLSDDLLTVIMNIDNSIVSFSPFHQFFESSFISAKDHIDDKYTTFQWDLLPSSLFRIISWQLDRIHPMANSGWRSDIFYKSFINFLFNNRWFITILWLFSQCRRSVFTFFPLIHFLCLSVHHRQWETQSFVQSKRVLQHV